MKILILQLARLGDVFMTWPVARALKRAHPEAEIHLLTRKKFADAAVGLEAVAKVWELDSRAILAPLIDERPDLDSSLEELAKVCDILRGEAFDRIVNLSYSPFSSFLARQARAPETAVRGYTRHDDGYLAIPDDASAYFYAQVGPGRPNRIHLTEIFAEAADVRLEGADWRGPTAPEAKRGDGPIVIHVGASDARKTYGAHKWQAVVQTLLRSCPGEVVLIGSPAEREMAESVAQGSGARRPVNKVGETQVPELFPLIASARLVIGCDSAPMHIAALTGTPVLNLSFSTVNFWETGPKSAGSRVLVYASEADLPSDVVAAEALAMLAGRETAATVVHVPGGLEPYRAPASLAHDFTWELVQALYLGAPFPAPTAELFFEGVRRLGEVNVVAVEQLAALERDPRNEVAMNILNRVDEVIESIGRLVPDLAPLVRWFQTDKIRVPPGEFSSVLGATRVLHQRLGDIVGLYQNASGETGAIGEEKSNDGIVLG